LITTKTTKRTRLPALFFATAASSVDVQLNPERADDASHHFTISSRRRISRRCGRWRTDDASPTSAVDGRDELN